MVQGVQSLSAVVGASLRARRQAAGVRLEQVAAAARSVGLTDWRTITVATIELGRRNLSAGELLLLPRIVAEVGLGRVSLASLIPNDGRLVRLADDAVVPARRLRAWLPEWRAPYPTYPRLIPAWRRKPRGPVISLAALDALDRSAERHAARRLGIEAETVAQAAQARWGHSLSDERDARVREREARLHAAYVVATPADVARRRQAERGHVTRALLDELRPLVNPTKKRRRRR
jgi:hypothetical protein